MSMPEPADLTNLETEHRDLVPTAPRPTRTTRVRNVVGHRLPEIFGVGLPLWPALAWSPWWAGISIAAAAWWVLVEYHMKRKPTGGGDSS